MTRTRQHAVVRSLCVLLAIAIASCASSAAGPKPPDVKIVQVSKVPLIRADTAGLPMEYQLHITNTDDEPITLTSVEVESVGNSGAYTLKRVRHVFDVQIPPNASQQIDFRAWIQRLQTDVAGEAGSPVLLRGSATFESASGSVRRNFVGRGQ